MSPVPNLLGLYFTWMASKRPTLLRVTLFAMAAGPLMIAMIGRFREEQGRSMPSFLGNWVYWFYLAMVAFALSLAARVWRFMKKMSSTLRPDHRLDGTIMSSRDHFRLFPTLCVQINTAPQRPH